MRVKDASAYLCGEANPTPRVIVGRDMGGAKAELITDRPCVKAPGHVAAGDKAHRDIEGREWT